MQDELTPYELFQLEKYGNILPEPESEDTDQSVWTEEMQRIELKH